MSGDPAGGRPLPPPAWAPPPSPGAPAATVATRRRRRWPWVVGAAALVVALVVALVGVGLVVLRRDGGRSSPDTWDPAVADLVPFVEQTKGAEFEHPVTTVFLSDEEFDERVAPDESAMTDDDRADLARDESTLRALGLQGGSGSLLDQQTSMTTEGVAAYYDPDQQEIVIPESAGDSLLDEQTLVHELTHALQDQLGELDDEPTDSDASLARRALLEGDAERVASAWADSLDDDDQRTIDDETAHQSGDADVDDVSPALLASFTFPYTVGAPMVGAIDGAGRLAGAFDQPPASTADVLDPQRWLTPIDRVDVDEIDLGDGERAEGDADTLGALNLYLMLASALAPDEALGIADGWGGDRMQRYRGADDVLCTRIALTGADGAASDALEAAVTTWAAGRPASTARASRRGDIITIDACDPGDAASSTLTKDAAMLPAVRAQLIAGWTGEGGYELEQATCITEEMLGRLPVELFGLDELTSEQQREASDAVTEAMAACPG